MDRWFFFLVTIGLVQTAVAQLSFTDIAPEIGIAHSYNSALLGGGVSWYDFDGDGWDDLTLATASGETIHFYRNNEGTFERLPDLVDNTDEAKQLLWVDIDNDGDQDFFVVTRNNVNRLYEQTDTLVFEDITLAAGLPSYQSFTYGAAFGDYDRDGYVDLYFGLRLNGTGFPNQHLMFRNNGDNTFTNTTAATMTTDSSGLQFCSSFIDYNNDNWPDLYTAHDREANPNTLLENNGDGTFSDTGSAANADLAIEAMSVTLGDYNNDGWQDIYCTNIAEGSKFLVNEGPDSTGQVVFSEQANAAGIGFFGMGWGSVFLDGDNDGDQDLYVSGSSAGSDAISAAYFQNENDGTFSQPELGFVGDTAISYNNAIGDYNQDGYPDLAVINVFPFTSAVWSSPPLDNNWLKIKLTGVESNRNAIGARITCFTDSVQQQRYLQCGNGFLGQNSGTELFGFGGHSLIDSVQVLWPSGQVDRLYAMPVNRQICLREGSTQLSPVVGFDPLLLSCRPDTFAVVPNKSTDLQLSELQVYPSPTRDILQLDHPNL
ncbi:MAG: CRTAC1 family protein, partial [Bacteroidota bacterium]